MTKLSVIGAFFALFLLIVPAAAQEAAPADWQTVITGQIEAFREHDSAAALSFAGASFKQGFGDPEAFYRAIEGMGYAPLMTSRAHSFGVYELVAPNVVMQAVSFTGDDQALYEAIYQLNLETDGWRVAGVQMVKKPGIGV